MATARSGTFLAVHALCDSGSAQPARAKALGAGNGVYHREFVGAHVVNNAAANRSSNTEQRDAPLAARVFNPLRKAIRDDARAVFADAVRASGLPQQEVAVATGASAKDVCLWMSGEKVPSGDQVLLIIRRVPQIGVEILDRCICMLPPAFQRVLADRIAKRAA